MEHYGKELKKALAAASAVVEERDRIEAAIEDLNKQLTPAYNALREARQELGSCQADQALGRESGIEAAKRRFTSATANLQALADGILMLKARLDSQEPALTAAISGIEPHLEESAKQAANRFVAERWKPACEAFAKVLGELALIEKATGTSLGLAMPVAASIAPSADLTELGRPRQLLDQLQQAVSQIRMTRTMRDRDRARSRAELSFEPDQVYQFVKEVTISGHRYSLGDQCIGKLLGEAGFKYCASVRALRLADTSEQLAAAG